MNLPLRARETVVAFREAAASHASRPAEQRDTEHFLELIRSIGHPDLRDYCIEQIRSARSAEDIEAVVELIFEVTRKRA